MTRWKSFLKYAKIKINGMMDWHNRSISNANVDERLQLTLKVCRLLNKIWLFPASLTHGTDYRIGSSK